jgi:hypothetical protein
MFAQFASKASGQVRVANKSPAATCTMQHVSPRGSPTITLALSAGPKSPATSNPENQFSAEIIK